MSSTFWFEKKKRKRLNPCHAEKNKIPCPLLIFCQSDYLLQIVDINSHHLWQTVQIQIIWVLKKPTGLDLHCLQRQGISGFSRTRVKKTSLRIIIIFIKGGNLIASLCYLITCLSLERWDKKNRSMGFGGSFYTQPHNKGWVLWFQVGRP